MRTKLWGLACSLLLAAGACSSDSGGGTLGIVSFSASPSPVAFSGSILISWQVTAAEHIRLQACSGFNPDDSSDWCAGGTVRELAVEDPHANTGTLVTNLLITTRFELTAFGSGDKFLASDPVQVDIQAAPPAGPQVVDFRADPREITTGDSATLIVDVKNATQVTVSDATAAPHDPTHWVDPTGGAWTLTADDSGEAMGTRDVSPTLTRLYGLKDADGRVLGYAQLLVHGTVPDVPHVVAFSVDPTEIDEGDTATLSWATTNATALTVSPTVTGFTGTTLSGTQVFTPPYYGIGDSRVTITTYTLSATNGAFTDSAQLLLTVHAAPHVTTFTALPATVAAGDDVTLTWATTRADAVTITAVPDDATLLTTFALSGTATVNPAEDTTYTITATGSTVATATATASVTVTP